MTRQKYSIGEAINRILRSFQGKTIPSDAPNTLSGEILSVDTALSDLAELLEDSLPGETGTLPPGLSVPATLLPYATTEANGSIEIATNAEAIAGTDTEKAVTPAGVLAFVSNNIAAQTEYGGIYNEATGTATIDITNSFLKITGSFTDNMVSSDHITPNASESKITISINGVYFVGVQMSFEGTLNATMNGAIFVDNVIQDQLRFRRKMGTGGDVGSASALGIIQVTGSPVDLDFRVKRDVGTGVFSLKAGQIWVFGVPGGN